MSDDENYDDISVNSDLDVEYLEGDESGNSKRRTKIFRKKARALNIVTGIVKSRANNERIEKTFKTLKESSIEKDEKDVDIDITEDPTHRNRKDGISLRRNSREMAEINVSISSVKTTNTILSKTESHSLPESSSRITDIRVEEQTSSAKMPQIFSDESEEEELILEERQEIREGHLIQPDNFSLDIQDETDPRQQFVNCNLSRQFTKKDKKQLKKIFKRIESQEQSSTEESDLEMGDEGHDKPEGHRKSKRSMKKSVKNASIKRTFSFKSFRNKEKADPGKEKKIKKKETVESEVSEQIIMVEDDDTENKSKKNYYNKKTVHKPIKCPNLEKIDEKEEPFSDRSLGYGKFPCVKKDNVEQELHTILRRLQDLQFKMVSSGGANGISRCRDDAATLIQSHTMEGESIRLVQYYFQKWKMKTLFQALQMYRADKQQQLVFLSQQVHLYGQELQAKLQRHNMLLDLSNIRSEAHGAHRSLLSKPQTQIPKLTLDHSLNVFFDTNYLCDPSQARKGRHDNDDWEAPFKSRSSASVTRAKNMGTQFALHNTTDHQEDERNEAEYPPQPIQSVEKPSRVMSPVMLQARSPSPDVPGSPMRVWSPALPPNVPPIERCHSKRAEVVKLSKHPVNMLQPTDAKTGLPVYNKFPVSYLNKKEPSKPPVVLSTWETRDNNGYTNQLTAESSVDVKQTGLEIDAVAEMRERSTESQKGEDMPYNFQGMLRKTKYSRESMKRNQNNSPVPRSPSPPKLIIKSSRSPTPTKSIISPRSPSPPKSIISPKLPSPPRSSTPVFYTRDSPEVDELEHSIPDVIRDNIQSSFDDSLIAETDEAML